METKRKIKFDASANLTQQCYEQIKNEIVLGHLKQGQKLKITELKERFSVGQNPIREALSRLLSINLVTFEENKGFSVAPISEAELYDIWEVFLIIELNGLKLSLQRGDVEWEAKLMAEHHRSISLEKKSDGHFWLLWNEPMYLFHRALIAGCKSLILLEMQRLIYLKTNRYAYLAYPENPEISNPNFSKSQKEDHKKLVELAIKRDIKGVEKLMKNHVNDFFENMVSRLKKKKLI